MKKDMICYTYTCIYIYKTVAFSMQYMFDHVFAIAVYIQCHFITLQFAMIQQRSYISLYVAIIKATVHAHESHGYIRNVQTCQLLILATV